MSRSQTPSYAYGASSGVNDFAHAHHPDASSPLSQSMHAPGGHTLHDDHHGSQRDTSVTGGDDGDGLAARLDRSASSATTAVPAATPSRGGTLKKKSSMRRANSLKRSSSKRSMKAGSIAGFGGGREHDPDFNSYASTPVPTQGAPTEILANRFQAWRQLLKSLITYFREVQASYEARSKALHKVQTTIANIAHPAIFMSEHGLGDATRILDDHHRRSVTEANKSREIENDVIGALTGLRSDLSQKIKEIKSLSGDFKNSVEREKDATRREVEKLQDALQHADIDDGNAVGKNDPFVIRLGVERAVEKQIDEENYLHRAYLNLESSGRELESIIVGEIQKAYNAIAGILKREGDDAYGAVEALRTGPISMPKDAEWLQFIEHDSNFVDPNTPLRRIEDIEYPGKHNPAAAEVRSGMLERKSKYLKSYTPGWYVLSPTHLHEFKSADKLYTQPPVMSLYLPDQRLGSRSQADSSSHKFMLKGKQSGGMHKGHNWVFRAETYDTMLAWNEDIRNLTEKTGEERTAFVRKHARSVSGLSDRGTVSSDGMDEDDEADAVPYSADAQSLASRNPPPEQKPARPQPGGRINSSDMLAPRNLRTANNNATATAPLSPSDASSDDGAAVAASTALPGSAQEAYQRNGQDPYRLEGVSAGTRPTTATTELDGAGGGRDDNPYFPSTTVAAAAAVPMHHQQQYYQQQEQQAPEQQQQPSFLAQQPADPDPYATARNDPLASTPKRMDSESYGTWMAPAATAAAVGGVAGAAAYGSANPQHEAERNDDGDDDDNSVGVLQPQTYQPQPQQQQQQQQQQQPEPQVYQPSHPPPTTTTSDTMAFFAAAAPAPVGHSASTSEADRHPPRDGSISTTDFAAAAATATPAPAPASSASDAAAEHPSTGPVVVQPVSRTGGGAQGKETGQFFPAVVRHATDISVSALHVPGEFPKQV